MPRILSVWLDRWPIRRFLQAQSRKPAAEPVDPARPFVLAVDASGGPKVAALNEAARAEGIAAGERIADARARARGLQMRDLDPQADAAALRRLALWATRYTPAARAWNEDDGADGLFLDIAGASHLFGGEAALIADLRRRLAGFGLPARLALADAPGAGWALARYAGAADIRVPSGGERAAVERLPIEALRLDPATRFSLRRLGLKRVGDLLDKPRAPLSRRFGPGLLLRLDQILGRIPEPIDSVAAPPLYETARRFLDPIVAQSMVVRTARRLFEDLAPKLEQDGVGARRLRLMLYRVDGETVSVELGLAAPSRNATYIERLFDLRFDRLVGTIDPGFGFETIRLDAVSVEPLKPRQDTLSGSEGAAAGERAISLIDALARTHPPRRPCAGAGAHRAGMVAPAEAASNARLLHRRGRSRPPLLALPRRPLSRDARAALVRARPLRMTSSPRLRGYRILTKPARNSPPPAREASGGEGR